MISRLLASLAFYTCCPLPRHWTLDFQGIARFATLIGVGIGIVLGILDLSLTGLGMPVLTRSTCIILAWVGITGGLHLDGAIDSADGLAVTNPQRRLEVMADSTTGAFGAIAAVCVIILKIAALSDLSSDRLLLLTSIAGWGRWAQMLAIYRYPYLKPTGKGAFHKEVIQSLGDLVPSFLLLLSLSGVYTLLHPQNWPIALGLVLGGSAIAWLTGAWFQAKLGGQTGDTYGAIVEWTEALLLTMMTLF